MSGAYPKPDIKAALSKAGLNRMSVNPIDSNTGIAEGLCLPGLSIKQTVFELLDGTVPELAVKLVQGIMSTGRSDTRPRFRWAVAIAELNLSVIDILKGTEFRNSSNGTIFESWWTQNEQDCKMETFNLKLLHQRAMSWETTKDIKEFTILENQPQGVSLRICMSNGSAQNSFQPILIGLVQDKINKNCDSITEFSHRVAGLVNANEISGNLLSIDELYGHLLNRKSSRADFLLPEKKFEFLTPPGFADSSICFIRYEHLNIKQLAKLFETSIELRKYNKFFKEKETIMICGKAACFWDRLYTRKFGRLNDRWPIELNLQGVLVTKMEIELPNILNRMKLNYSKKKYINGDNFEIFLEVPIENSKQPVTVPGNEIDSEEFRSDGSSNIRQSENLVIENDSAIFEELERKFLKERSAKIEIEQQIVDLNNKVSFIYNESSNLKIKLNQCEDLIANIRKCLGNGEEPFVGDIVKRINDLRAKLISSENKAIEEESFRINYYSQIVELRDINQRLSEELIKLTVPKNSEGDTDIGDADISADSVNSILLNSKRHFEDTGAIPTYFASIHSSQSLSTIKEQYAYWLLGLGANESARNERLESGINPSWVPGNLLGRNFVELEGEKGLGISIRASDDAWVLRFVRPDTSFPGNTWWDLVRLTSETHGTNVEHALVRFADHNAVRSSVSGIPSVLRDLFPTAINPEIWDNWDGVPLELSHDNINHLVMQGLLNPKRYLPVVVASRAVADGELYVSPADLSLELQGLAAVWYISEGDGFLLSNALRAASVESRQLSCWDGAVRAYLPNFVPESDPYEHPLWIRKYLALKSGRDRIHLIRERVLSSLVGVRLPTGFAHLIDEYDLARASETSARLLKLGHQNEQVIAFVAQIELLKDANEKLMLENEQIANIRSRLLYFEALNDEFDRERQDAQLEAEDQRRRAGKLQIQVDQMQKMENSDNEGNISIKLIDGLIRGTIQKYGDFARILQSRYRDRVIFLPEALISADICTFTRDDKAKDLMLKLVTEYYDAMLNGEGDSAGVRIFGQYNFASMDKDKERLSSTGIRDRTFEYDGENLYMETHLKITHGKERNTSYNVFRVFFKWDAQRKKIIVGHIGKHLRD